MLETKLTHLRTRVSLTLAAIGFLILPVAPASASDVTVDVVGTETGTWSSNPLLSTGSVKPLIGSTTSPEIIVKDETPTSAADLDARLDENLFNQSKFNSTDGHATADLSLQNQRWKLGTKLGGDYDTTRTSEVSNFGFNTVVARHLGMMAAPELTFAPNPLDAFSLAGSVTQSSYDHSIFTDYATYGVTPSYLHHFDPQNAGTFSVEAQRYQSLNDASIRIDSIGPSIGWQTSFSPRFTGNASVGAQTERQYNAHVATGPWTWQYVFSAGLAFKGLEDTINVDTKRTQFPYANGTEGLQTSFAVKESHTLNNALSLNFGANYLMATYQAPINLSIDSLAGGEVGVTYHVLQDLDLAADYKYRYETLTGTSATAQDNAVMLSLAYRPKNIDSRGVSAYGSGNRYWVVDELPAGFSSLRG